MRPDNKSAVALCTGLRLTLMASLPAAALKASHLRCMGLGSDPHTLPCWLPPVLRWLGDEWEQSRMLRSGCITSALEPDADTVERGRPAGAAGSCHGRGARSPSLPRKSSLRRACAELRPARTGGGADIDPDGRGGIPKIPIRVLESSSGVSSHGWFAGDRNENDVPAQDTWSARRRIHCATSLSVEGQQHWLPSLMAAVLASQHYERHVLSVVRNGGGLMRATVRTRATHSERFDCQRTGQMQAGSGLRPKRSGVSVCRCW